ncbi:hypothetical protein, partial [Chroococcidiopsis sp.]|uniref:hypothetical protein n=1 Tax=Chroococcidiopsis sp. TaxID=3088168 RepID=UPI003F2FC01B
NSIVWIVLNNNKAKIIIMAGKSRYNWKTIRAAYVSGEMSLYELSKESTGLETDPPYQSIRRAASCDSEGKWDESRQAFRYNVATQVATTPTAQAVVQQTEQLVDAAGAIARHIQLAKSLQASYAAIQNQLRQSRAIEQMDFSSLNPLEIALIMQRLAAIASRATDIERKAMGLSDPTVRAEVSVEGKVNVQIGLLEAIERARELDPNQLQARIRDTLN